MANITILQADNRPDLNYLLLTQEVNKKVCDYFGYKYSFIKIDDSQYTYLHPATKKIYIVNDFINNSNYDRHDDDNNNNIVVFLDSDAWVQDSFKLHEIIENLQNNEIKHGCFSRDPYLKKNTFVNSGSFILKINDYTRKMYSEIISSLENDENNSQYKNNWPYDQFYISNYVFNHRNDFNIFVPDILNTPMGKVLRHNWHKTGRMYHDLYDIIHNPIVDKNIDSDPDIDNSLAILEKYYDEEVFPNIHEVNFEYII
jgi:hypothetical protein